MALFDKFSDVAASLQTLADYGVESVNVTMER
jgi:hypothetical protein